MKKIRHLFIFNGERVVEEVEVEVEEEEEEYAKYLLG